MEEKICVCLFVVINYDLLLKIDFVVYYIYEKSSIFLRKMLIQSWTNIYKFKHQTEKQVKCVKIIATSNVKLAFCITNVLQYLKKQLIIADNLEFRLAK